MNKDRVNKNHPRATHQEGASHVLLNPRSFAFIRTLVFLALVIGVVGCGRSPQPIVVAAVATATLAPAPTLWLPYPTPSPRPTPTPTATPAGWETIREGVQIRQSVGFENDRGTYVYALRLDPSRVDVRLRYDPERPLHVSGWFAAEQPPLGDFGPIAALNAGFFRPDNTPLGRWVIDGITFGHRHRRMQGEFRVGGAGVSIRRLSEPDQDGDARITASIESYPLLLLPGGIVNPCLAHADERIERLVPSRSCVNLTDLAERLVVGIDGAGHLVFILFPSQAFTLPGLARWLKHSDFNLDAALNLDGGSSAGMLAQDGDRVLGQDSGRDVPGAIVVLPKEFSAGGGESP